VLQLYHLQPKVRQVFGKSCNLPLSTGTPPAIIPRCPPIGRLFAARVLVLLPPVLSERVFPEENQQVAMNAGASFAALFIFCLRAHIHLSDYRCIFVTRQRFKENQNCKNGAQLQSGRVVYNREL
jgi:hypothetical protein